MNFSLRRVKMPGLIFPLSCYVVKDTAYRGWRFLRGKGTVETGHTGEAGPMSKPNILGAWRIVQGSGSIQEDPTTGEYRIRAGGSLVVRSFDHPPFEAERYAVAEVAIQADTDGVLHLAWERSGGKIDGSLSQAIRGGHRHVARFPVYVDPGWTHEILAVRLRLPEGLSKGVLGPFYLYAFSDLDPKELQKFATLSARVSLVENKGLKVSVQYTGVYLAPVESEKWIQVSLLDDTGHENISVARATHGNYDARYIHTEFFFPEMDRVWDANVYLLDNGTGYSLVCRARPEPK